MEREKGARGNRPNISFSPTREQIRSAIESIETHGFDDFIYSVTDEEDEFVSEFKEPNDNIKVSHKYCPYSPVIIKSSTILKKQFKNDVLYTEKLEKFFNEQPGRIISLAERHNNNAYGLMGRSEMIKEEFIKEKFKLKKGQIIYSRYYGQIGFILEILDSENRFEYSLYLPEKGLITSPMSLNLIIDKKSNEIFMGELFVIINGFIQIIEIQNSNELLELCDKIYNNLKKRKFHIPRSDRGYVFLI